MTESLRLRGVRLDPGAIEVQMAKSHARARLFGRPAEPIRLGRFVILRRLGSGGMGVVYEAYDPQLDRKVALKLLRSDVSASAAPTSRSRLDEAFEAGVDVRLGVTAWAGFVNGPTAHGLPKPVIALADLNRSWLMSFDKLIVAAGRRDLGFAFPGWELPGVMGAAALHALIHRYHAFAGRRILVLGGGRLGFGTALDARREGFDVAAIVEAAPAFSAPKDMIEAAETIVAVAEDEGAAVREEAEAAADGADRRTTTFRNRWRPIRVRCRTSTTCTWNRPTRSNTFPRSRGRRSRRSRSRRPADRSRRRRA